jgi:hypothetical protein
MDILEMVIYGASRSEGNYSACLTFYSSSLNSMAAVVVMYSVAVLIPFYTDLRYHDVSLMEMKHRDVEELCEM